MERIDVFLVDDSKFHLEGAKLALKDEACVRVVGDACTLQQALDGIAEHRPHVVLMDIKLESGHEGVHLARELRKQYSNMKIIMFSHYNSSYLIVQSLRAGANAYLPKDVSIEELTNCILSVMEDNDIFYGETIPQETINMCNKYLSGPSDEKPAKLSKQEINIIEWLAKGLSPKEISLRQGITVHTIETHKERIRKKTGCRTVIEMAIYAIKNDIISLG